MRLGVEQSPGQTVDLERFAEPDQLPHHFALDPVVVVDQSVRSIPQLRPRPVDRVRLAVQLPPDEERVASDATAIASDPPRCDSRGGPGQRNR
jgi:hypothetical protein